MKKIFLVLILLSICGCDKKIVPPADEVVTPTIDISYTDDNPLDVGLYLFEDNILKLKNEIISEWKISKDITVLTTVYSNKETLGNYFVGVFNEEKNKYSTSKDYKIGYNIKFEADGIKYSETILRPDDMMPLFDYIQVYLYDDIYHQNDSWYRHTTEEEVTSDTLLTTIKLTGSDYTYKITSDIILTVFTYDDMDDFINNEYRGNSKYSVTLKKNNL